MARQHFPRNLLARTPPPLHHKVPMETPTGLATPSGTLGLRRRTSASGERPARAASAAALPARSPSGAPSGRRTTGTATSPCASTASITTPASCSPNRARPRCVGRGGEGPATEGLRRAWKGVGGGRVDGRRVHAARTAARLSAARMPPPLLLGRLQGPASYLRVPALPPCPSFPSADTFPTSLPSLNVGFWP